MIIKLEGVTEEEATSMFTTPTGHTSLLIGDVTNVIVNGLNCMAVLTDWSRDSIPHYHPSNNKHSFRFESVRVVKSSQEIAAEESVRKAESALQAAKDVLGKVKGV